jgi:hypothetical protein
MDGWGFFLFIAGSAGLLCYHPVFQVQKKIASAEILPTNAIFSFL